MRITLATLAFADRVRRDATPEVENAIDVFYIEGFALDEVTDAPPGFEANATLPPSGLA
jgi:hypothetical protein